MEQTESEYDKEKFSERLAKLTGGVAIIRVGAATEADMKQKKARVEDALHATRAAVAEGILPGGGVALLRAIPRGRARLPRSSTATRSSAPKSSPGPGEADPHASPRTPAWTARSSPTRSGNAEKSTSTSASTPIPREYVDMFKAGIIDPTKVTRSALQNAASIAGLMLTTEV